MSVTTTTPTAHIRLDERGVAYIDNTRWKVIQVAMDVRTHGWSAEEIQRQYEGAPLLAQLHAALSYYYDHQAEFDAEIDRRAEEYEKLWAENKDSPLRKKLRDKGPIP